MNKLLIIILLTFNLFDSRSQSYFDEIVEKHLSFFYSEDSVQISDEKEIRILHDSLIFVNEKKQLIKKYWETDDKGKIVNLFFEISKNKLFVIQQLDTPQREYFLYKKKGKKKIILLTWIDGPFEKQKKTLVKTNASSIHYFKDDLFF